MNNLFSYSTFSVARVLMALCVFFCHLFEPFNDFGFLFVGVFFFMSGYGMEYMNKRSFALTRTVPYILYFLWFSLIYFFVFQKWVYPSGWFLVVYFVLMLIYRFVRNIYVLLVSFLIFAFFMEVCGFEFGWSTSYGGFLFGVFFARNQSAFTLSSVLMFIPGVLLVVFGVQPALWCLIPLFSWIVLHLSSFLFMRRIAFMGDYTFFFYCIHCFVLGLFGATWTLGGAPSFMACLGAFCVSVVVSVFFKDYLFNYPKIQKAG